MPRPYSRSTAAGRYGRLRPEPTPVVPKFDPLRRDLLPPDYPEFEHVVPDAEPTFQHWENTAPWPYLVGLTVFAFLLTQVARLLGPYLSAPPLRPLWFVVTVALPLWLYLRDRETRRALPALVVVPLLFAALFFGSASSFISKVVLVYAALLLAGAFLDAVGAHAVELLLAKATLADGLRERMLAAWRHRFDAAFLETERSRLQTAAAKGQGDVALEEHFLGVLLSYQQGFLVLLLAGVLAILPNPLVLLLVLPPVAALLLLARVRPSLSAQQVLESLVFAAETWLTYGRGGHSPGTFKSPAGSRQLRLLWTALVVFLLAAALSPATPYAALVVAAFGEQSAGWRIALESLGSWALPLLLLSSAGAALLSRLLLDLERLLPASSEGQVSSWERFVGMLERSESARHRRQLFLGLHATEGYPVFLSLETLRQHAHVLGSTGTGKTSLVVLPLVAQLIRRKEHPENPHFQGPILIIDMKGTDTYAFHAVREVCRKEGRTLRFFTNLTGSSSYAFNPMLEFIASQLTLQQRGESMRSALNIEHGTGYGQGHFSAVSRRYLQLLLRTRPGAESFTELMDVRRELERQHGRRWVKEQEDEAGELLTALEMLSEREELNVTEAWAGAAPSPEEEARRRDVLASRVNMERAFLENEVLYFYLYSHSEEAVCRYIASLALESFYAACTLRNRSVPPAERKQAYVFVDEFQQVAGRNFQNFMEQARSSGVALVLANQSRGQLDDELQKAVANTGYRHFFDFQDPEDLSFISAVVGETVQLDSRILGKDGSVQEGVSTTMNQSPLGSSSIDWENTTLRQARRFSVNDLTALSAHSDVALIKQKQNVDYSQFDGFPFPIRAMHHISRMEKDALEHLPWPAGETGTLLLQADVQAVPAAAATVAGDVARPPTGGRGPSRIPPTPRDPALEQRFSRIELAGSPVLDHYEITDKQGD